MPDALILEFTGASVEQYLTVHEIIGIDAATGKGDWPVGLLSHTGAAGDDGELVVFEVWDSQESQEAFMATRLGPALNQVGLPEPSRADWLSLMGGYHSS